MASCTVLHMPMVTVRLSEGEKAAWLDGARARGMTLTGFLKVCVREAVETRSSRAIAQAVSLELLPELERMLAEYTGEPASASGAFELSIAKTFDRGCFDAELHREGHVCQGCGGSSY